VAASAAVDPPSDIHAGAAYRRSLIGTLVERALRSAAA
jgi:CO/xanthine dehydrogenase FAD-binding subunit